MAAKSIIDSLPAERRQKVVDALLRGESLRDVAKVAGVTHQAIARYKRVIVMPAIRAAQKVQAAQQLTDTSASVVESQTRLTKAIVAASPFRDRLEELWSRTDKALTQAEESKELGVMAPLLNQAHKNVELLGRVTGELEVSAPMVAIQVVCPVEIRPAGPEPPTIDISLTR